MSHGLREATTSTSPSHEIVARAPPHPPRPLDCDWIHRSIRARCLRRWQRPVAQPNRMKVANLPISTSRSRPICSAGLPTPEAASAPLPIRRLRITPPPSRASPPRESTPPKRPAPRPPEPLPRSDRIRRRLDTAVGRQHAQPPPRPHPGPRASSALAATSIEPGRRRTTTTATPTPETDRRPKSSLAASSQRSPAHGSSSPRPVAIATGMRRGEILALRWQDLDPERKIAHVQRSLQPTKHGLVFKQPKTARSRRAVALPTFLKPYLETQQRDQASRRDQHGDAWTELDLIIDRGDGNPINPDTLSTGWARRLRKHKHPTSAVPRLTPRPRHPHAHQGRTPEDRLSAPPKTRAVALLGDVTPLAA